MKWLDFASFFSHLDSMSFFCADEIFLAWLFFTILFRTSLPSFLTLDWPPFFFSSFFVCLLQSLSSLDTSSLSPSPSLDAGDTSSVAGSLAFGAAAASSEPRPLVSAPWSPCAMALVTRLYLFRCFLLAACAFKFSRLVQFTPHKLHRQGGRLVQCSSPTGSADPAAAPEPETVALNPPAAYPPGLVAPSAYFSCSVTQDV
mmetsp:Transcript_7225/g.26192  ORF Transcript_7225/g.26192 Transcript_7225/m.26192 type:complete len:201 (-) Transcript_7225:236-838(-)